MSAPKSHPRGPRVRVTATRHQAAPARPASPLTTEIAQTSALGDTYVHGLVRRLRGIALMRVVLLSALSFLIPVLPLLAPDWGFGQLFALPLAWLALWPLSFASITYIAWRYVQSVESVEREFVDMVMGPQTTRGEQ